MMLRFLSLTIRNFLSYGNNVTVFQLDRPGTTLIVGEDLDNTADGKGANGVGKSALINALTYACYDRPISNISLDNLVNNINKKNMEVIVEFIAPNGKTYMVRRTRKAKAGAAGNTVYLFENGDDITPDSARATNALVEKIIGVPYELFIRIVVFSAAHVPFLDLKQNEQAEIIEELFGLTMLSQKALALKDMIRSTELTINTVKTKIDMVEKEKVRHKQLIKAAEDALLTWKVQNSTTIKRLKEQLKKIEAVDIDSQRTLHDTAKGLTAELNEQMSARTHAQEHMKITSKDIAKNELELEHLRDNKCPRCLQIYENAKIEILDMERKSEHLVTNYEAKKTIWDEFNDSIKQLAHSLQTTKAQITVDNVEELVRIRSESTNIHAKVVELEQAVNPHQQHLDALRGAKIEEIDYEDINKATKILEHQQLLLKLLTKKDSFVRKKLLNNNIPYLNSRLQHYLTLLGLPHRVTFTHEMSAKITQLGRELDFGNLSAGQKARVNFGLALAFKDVLQHQHTKINVCMLDEVLDIGLDTIGVQAAARLLKRKARDEELSLYIISHRDEIDRAFDKIVTVQFSKGFSYIKED